MKVIIGSVIIAIVLLVLYFIMGVYAIYKAFATLYGGKKWQQKSK